ncbi:MAG: hypothetical protein AVDCRST_MAG49-189, partial [uncultured Thermomicrobiales bacterium]
GRLLHDLAAGRHAADCYPAHLRRARRAALRAVGRGQHRPRGADAGRRVHGGDRRPLRRRPVRRPCDRGRRRNPRRGDPRGLVHHTARRPGRRRHRDQPARAQHPRLPHPAPVRYRRPHPDHRPPANHRARAQRARPGRVSAGPDRLVPALPDQARAARDGRGRGPPRHRERRHQRRPLPLRLRARQRRARRARRRRPLDRRPLVLHLEHDAGAGVHRARGGDLRELVSPRHPRRDPALRRRPGDPDPGPDDGPADLDRRADRPPLRADADRDHRVVPQLPAAGGPRPAPDHGL